MRGCVPIKLYLQNQVVGFGSRPATDPWSDPFNPFIKDTAMNKTDMSLTLRELSFLLGMILCYC